MFYHFHVLYHIVNAYNNITFVAIMRNNCIQTRIFDTFFNGWSDDNPTPACMDDVKYKESKYSILRPDCSPLSVKSCAKYVLPNP